MTTCITYTLSRTAIEYSYSIYNIWHAKIGDYSTRSEVYTLFKCIAKYQISVVFSYEDLFQNIIRRMFMLYTATMKI